ncbi:endonuclease V [Flavobacterium album]|uniref:Endonuclease V n=1 Tax=Flavobacterium album TaxID=2175091 RepID=A0A2S1QUK4_9FLAO|nr:endonuclease V [Flavobacterium album]AWH84009.1 endonuclease V [Flavobacterium album]
MILAFDTYYYDNNAKTIALQFAGWQDTEPLSTYSEIIQGVADYEPRAFYKRELPCILSLLKQIDLSQITVIVVDGFVYLDDKGTFGLGGYLYSALKEQIPVIGVAKTNFATIEKCKEPVYRGDSKNPLYITAIGTDLNSAAQNIRQMHGSFRMPALLQKLDGLTKAV